MKRQRILTNRDFPESLDGFEYIEMEEIDGEQYFYWRVGERKLYLREESDAYRWHNVAGEGCFPVPMDFVQETFARLGRDYRVSGKEKYKTYADSPIW